MTAQEIVTAVSNHLENVIGLCSDLDEKVKESSIALDTVRKREQEQIEIYRQAKLEREKGLKSLTSEMSELEEQVKPLRSEKQQLDQEIGTLVTKKADLQIENSRLETKNAEFRAYEEKAWKVLNAKDDGLIEREKVLEQKENLKPKSRSLLPPME